MIPISLTYWYIFFASQAKLMLYSIKPLVGDPDKDTLYYKVKWDGL